MTYKEYFLIRVLLSYNIEENLKFIKRAFIYCGLFGIFALVISFITENNSIFQFDPIHVRIISRISGEISNIFLCFFYASALVILYRKKIWQKILSPLSNLGRMALTNYILQAFCFGLIFYRYGFGFNGQTDIFLLFMAANAMFFLEIILSSLWLKKFNYGPIEWVWRSLTYKKLLTFR